MQCDKKGEEHDKIVHEYERLRLINRENAQRFIFFSEHIGMNERVTHKVTTVFKGLKII